MSGLIEQNPAVLFPLFFVVLWLAVSTIITVLSGWFRLMARFPDQPSEPLLQLRMQTGSMGLGVNMRGILTLSVCATGLRVGIMRIFAPFCRDFFVPWEAIIITRKKLWFWQVARLEFGSPAVGSLTIPARVADRLANAAKGRWPETGPFPEDPHLSRLHTLLVLAVLVPPIVLGILMIIRHFH